MGRTKPDISGHWGKTAETRGHEDAGYSDVNQHLWRAFVARWLLRESIGGGGSGVKGVGVFHFSLTAAFEGGETLRYNQVVERKN